MHLRSGEIDARSAQPDQQEIERSYGSMTREPRRKKRSEKLSDSIVARLARERAPLERSDERSDAPMARKPNTDRAGLASMGAQQAHSFTRCPHCREYVPIRDTCRACGTPIN
jgi:hypothetical protein